MTAQAFFRTSLTPPVGQPRAAILHLDRGDSVMGIVSSTCDLGVRVRQDDGYALVPWETIRWIVVEGPARKKLGAAEARRKPKTKVTA